MPTARNTETCFLSACLDSLSFAPYFISRATYYLHLYILSTSYFFPLSGRALILFSYLAQVHTSLFELFYIPFDYLGLYQRHRNRMRSCGCYYRRGCRCNMSLVKQVGRNSRVPLMIETSEGTWHLGQRAIARHWPALLNDFRSSGNRILVPQQRFGRLFKSWGELEMEPHVWEFLASRLARLEAQCSHQYNPLISGPGLSNDLLTLLERARDAWMAGDPSYLEALEYGLRLFNRICEVVGSFGGSGLGSRLYVEIIETARLYAPTVAELSLEELLMLLESVFIMTGRNQNTLVVLLKALTPQQQRDLLEACVDLQQEGSFLVERILGLFGV